MQQIIAQLTLNSDGALEPLVLLIVQLQIIMSQVEIDEEAKPFQFICLTCNLEFDSDAHAPYVLSNNLRTICKACLTKLSCSDSAQKKEVGWRQQEASIDANSAVLLANFHQLRQLMVEVRQGKGKPPGQGSGQGKVSLYEELQKQRKKNKWLIQYCSQLGTRYQDISVKQKKADAQISKKIAKYQESLQKLSKQFWKVRGDHEFEQENYEKIIEFSQHIITNSPNFDYQTHGFGSSEDQIGLFEVDPVKWYCKGRSDHNFNSSPYDILSLTYLITNNQIEAQQWYSAKIAKNHNSYQLLIGLANTEYNLGKYAEAAKLYERVVELRPELDKPYQQLAFIKALRENKREEGRKWAVIALERNSVNIYAKYLLAVTEQTFEARIEKLHKIVEENKNYARAYNGLGKLYKQKKNQEQALKWYKKAIEINPKYDAPYYGIGIIHYNRGEYDEAIKWFEESTRVNPQYQNPFFGLGSSYHKKNNNEEAIKWYNKCLQLNPNHVQAHNGLGTIYAILEKFDQAIKHFQKCTEIDPQHYLSQNALGNVYFYRGEYEEAIKFYLRSIEISPHYAAPYNGLSNVYLKKGEEVEARKWYERKQQLVQ